MLDKMIQSFCVVPCVQSISGDILVFCSKPDRKANLTSAMAAVPVICFGYQVKKCQLDCSEINNLTTAVVSDSLWLRCLNSTFLQLKKSIVKR